MDKITELAGLFKSRDNVQTFEISTAKVISVEPTILKLQDKAFLSKEYNNLILSATLMKDYKRKITLENQNTNLTEYDMKYKEYGFIVGDELIVIPINNGNLWYAIDKVVRL